MASQPPADIYDRHLGDLCPTHLATLQLEMNIPPVQPLLLTYHNLVPHNIYQVYSCGLRIILKCCPPGIEWVCRIERVIFT